MPSILYLKGPTPLLGSMVTSMIPVASPLHLIDCFSARFKITGYTIGLITTLLVSAVQAVGKLESVILNL
ncbi:hypothetical protein FLB_10500 [Flavobacterium succinicans]|uniref:Uncharacterized protein n=1 Tax=Flavobacterium succinicans TaxID=29536 RepID=A0A199XSC8_9FLAO|nr:hypothetical protein FLB_10500 [Flavobacterium succinicans]